MEERFNLEDLEIPKSLHRETLVFDLLDNTNYGIWRKIMRILLMRMCLVDLVDYDRPDDADASWEKADKWVFSDIKSPESIMCQRAIKPR